MFRVRSAGPGLEPPDHARRAALVVLAGVGANDEVTALVLRPDEMDLIAIRGPLRAKAVAPLVAEDVGREAAERGDEELVEIDDLVAQAAHLVVERQLP